MFKGRLRALNASANALMDFIEHRSSFKTSTRAFSLSLRIFFFASLASFKFLAAIMTCAPRRANTLAVSKPIPLAPPARSHVLRTSNESRTLYIQEKQTHNRVEVC